MTRDPDFLRIDPTMLEPALRDFGDGTIVLDFDDTLFTGNSTRRYLEAARPRFVVAAILSLLELLRPWRLLPGPDRDWVYRDWLRVLLVSVLLPWTAPVWRARAARIGRAGVNERLRAVLARREAPVVVATYGFRFIVAPLLSGMGTGWTLAVAAPLWSGYRLRRRGKAAEAGAMLGQEVLRRAVLLTDSEDDRDFLAVCHRVVLLPPSHPAEPSTLGTAYLPFQYIHCCKRQGENTLLRVILYYDLFVLLLAYVPASRHPWFLALGLTCFQLAFWTVYEIGNWENDVLGAAYEANPKIPASFRRWRNRFDPRLAWVWSAIFALPSAWCIACALDRNDLVSPLPNARVFLAMFAGLMTYLVVSRIIYAVYNRVDPVSRVYLYPVMQLLKAAALVGVLAASLPGLILAISVVLVRQARYLVYRYGTSSEAFETIPVNLHTMLCFCCLAAVTLCVADPPTGWSWVIGAVVILWHLQRARHEIVRAVRRFAWLPGRHR